MKINSINSYSLQQNRTFGANFLKTKEFIEFRNGLNETNKIRLDWHLKNITNFKDHNVFLFCTDGDRAWVSQAEGLCENESSLNSRKALLGSSNKVLVYRNHETNTVCVYPLYTWIEKSRDNALELFKNLSDFYTELKRIQDAIIQQR